MAALLLIIELEELRVKYLCDIADLPEQSTKAFPLDNSEIIVCNWYGKFYLYVNDCPHAGWPLNYEPDKFLDAEEQFLQCSNHMALFNVDDGLCVAGPCEGCALTAVPFEIKEDQIYAAMPETGYDRS